MPDTAFNKVAVRVFYKIPETVPLMEQPLEAVLFQFPALIRNLYFVGEMTELFGVLERVRKESRKEKREFRINYQLPDGTVTDSLEEIESYLPH